MCGICGIVDTSGTFKIGEDLIHRMCSAIAHRGPDDEGVYIETKGPSVGLGHRRLSIIDLSAAGHQPMSNEDGSIRVILNGEIYNYRELKTSLEEAGHKFKSGSDTEVLVHLYEEYKEACLDHIRGMYAFAVWDSNAGSIMLARDRIGKKPLLYQYENGVLSFASEFRSLIESGLVKKYIDHDAVNAYLTFGYIPSPLTVYKKVFKLPPGHRLILKGGKIDIKRYWGLDYSKKLNITEEDAASETLRLLKEAVKIRLYSDVPLGAFLSGGIDSSAVVAIMSGLMSGKVKTFSIGFEESGYDELKYARNIAEKYGTEHNEFILKPKAMEVLPLLVERYGEPYADSSAIPTYYVSRETKQYVTVALNGDGGDETFAGYERYQAMLVAEMYRRLPGWPRRVISGSAELLPDSIDPKNRVRNIKRFFQAAEMPAVSRYLRWISVFDESSKDDMYSDAFKSSISGDLPYERIGRYISGSHGTDMLDRLLETDVNMYLPDDLLVKVDIASMANSLEARSPFLDHKLMEFAAALPTHYKMKHLVKKYLLKKAIKDIVPAENIHRRKMGFGVPIGNWFRGELKSFMEDTLLSSDSLNRGYFRPDLVKRMVKEHTDKRCDHAYKLWALLMLELWHKRFIDNR